MQKSITVAGLVTALLGAGCSSSPEEHLKTAAALNSAKVAATSTQTAPKVTIDGRPYDAQLQEVECRRNGPDSYWVWRPQGGNTDPGTLSARINGPGSIDKPLVVQFIGAPGWPSLVYPDNARGTDLPGDTVEFTRTENSLKLWGSIYEDSDGRPARKLQIHTFEAELSCPDGWQSG